MSQKGQSQVGESREERVLALHDQYSRLWEREVRAASRLGRDPSESVIVRATDARFDEELRLASAAADENAGEIRSENGWIATLRSGVSGGTIPISGNNGLTTYIKPNPTPRILEHVVTANPLDDSERRLGRLPDAGLSSTHRLSERPMTVEEARHVMSVTGKPPTREQPLLLGRPVRSAARRRRLAQLTPELLPGAGGVPEITVKQLNDMPDERSCPCEVPSIIGPIPIPTHEATDSLDTALGVCPAFSGPRSEAQVLCTTIHGEPTGQSVLCESKMGSVGAGFLRIMNTGTTVLRVQTETEINVQPGPQHANTSPALATSIAMALVPPPAELMVTPTQAAVLPGESATFTVMAMAPSPGIVSGWVRVVCAPIPHWHVPARGEGVMRAQETGGVLLIPLTAIVSGDTGKQSIQLVSQHARQEEMDAEISRWAEEHGVLEKSYQERHWEACDLRRAQGGDALEEKIHAHAAMLRALNSLDGDQWQSVAADLPSSDDDAVVDVSADLFDRAQAGAGITRANAEAYHAAEQLAAFTSSLLSAQAREGLRQSDPLPPIRWWNADFTRLADCVRGVAEPARSRLMETYVDVLAAMAIPAPILRYVRANGPEEAQKLVPQFVDTPEIEAAARQQLEGGRRGAKVDPAALTAERERQAKSAADRTVVTRLRQYFLREILLEAVEAIDIEDDLAQATQYAMRVADFNASDQARDEVAENRCSNEFIRHGPYDGLHPDDIESEYEYCYTDPGSEELAAQRAAWEENQPDEEFSPEKTRVLRKVMQPWEDTASCAAWHRALQAASGFDNDPQGQLGSQWLIREQLKSRLALPQQELCRTRRALLAAPARGPLRDVLLHNSQSPFYLEPVEKAPPAPSTARKDGKKPRKPQQKQNRPTSAKDMTRGQKQRPTYEDYYEAEEFDLSMPLPGGPMVDYLESRVRGMLLSAISAAEPLLKAAPQLFNVDDQCAQICSVGIMKVAGLAAMSDLE